MSELTDINGVGPKTAERIREVMSDTSEVESKVREAHEHAQNKDWHQCTQMLEQAVGEL